MSVFLTDDLIASILSLKSSAPNFALTSAKSCNSSFTPFLKKEYPFFSLLSVPNLVPSSSTIQTLLGITILTEDAFVQLLKD